MKQTASRTSDQGMLSVWQQAVSQALSDTTFKQALLQRAAELLPSFADQYEKLKTLPHRLRQCRQRQWKRSLASVALLMA
jgi:flagellar hook-associated protein FlgK